MIAELFLVPISEPVAVLIFRTERCWFGIVHAMPHRWQRLEIRKYSLQIVIAKVAVERVGHGAVERARTHTASTNGPDELCLVVIANSRGVAGEVGAGGSAPGADEDSTTGEQHARHRPILLIGSSVAPCAAADVNQVLAVARRLRCI